MSNHQADDLFVETLNRADIERLLLILKPASIKPKLIKKLKTGMLIDGLDPYNLRIARGDEVVARAKLGRIGERETLHIVSTDNEALPLKPESKDVLLEARMVYLSQNSFEAGDIVEFDDPVSSRLLILADRYPVALGEIVEYEEEGWVHITRVLGE
jgi:hypothetical protein